MTTSMRMEEDLSHITEKILNLTLEIVYLLIGERVRLLKSGDHMTISVPPCDSLKPKRQNLQKILEVAKKMMELLTGEDWGYVDDLSEDMRKKCQRFTSPDGSSHGNPPERCPRPLYSQDSTQEGHTIPHHHQSESLGDLNIIVKEEFAEDDEEYGVMEELSEGHKDRYKDVLKKPPNTRNPPERCLRPLYSRVSTQKGHNIPRHCRVAKCKEDVNTKARKKETPVKDGQQSMQAIKMLATMQKKKSSLCSSSALGRDLRTHLKRTLTSHPISKTKDNGTTQPPPGVAPITQTRRPLVRRAKRSQNLSVAEEPSISNLKNGKRQILKKKFSCSQCKKAFTTKAYCNIHKRSHDKQRPFVCLVCGRGFSSNSSFLRHQRHHSEIRPYPCLECGKSFKEKSVLDQHLRIHSGDRPFPCLECGQRFIQKAHLRRHLRVHTGETPFSCKQCGKGFTRKDMLTLHEQRHVNERPFSCPECGNRFKQQFCLVRHKKLHEDRGSISHSVPLFKPKPEVLVHQEKSKKRSLRASSAGNVQKRIRQEKSDRSKKVSNRS